MSTKFQTLAMALSMQVARSKVKLAFSDDGC